MFRGREAGSNSNGKAVAFSGEGNGINIFDEIEGKTRGKVEMEERGRD